MDDWTLSLVDPAAFAREQQALAGAWTAVGFASDLAGDGAEIAGRIGGRPVALRRSGEAILGATAHPPREPLEVARCGELLFARFPGPGPGLQAFLGAAFPILAAIGDLADAPAIHSYGRRVEANWKLMVAITLDDYHTPAVHGRKRYQRREEFDYWRFGAHSAHAVGHDDSLEGMAAACAEGRYQPARYRIFNIFPNLVVTLFDAGPYWYAMTQQFDAEAPGRTRWRARYFRTRWRSGREPLAARLNPAGADWLLGRLIRRAAGRITEEDHQACERLQTVAAQIRSPTERLSAHEERVGWFYDAWRAALGAAQA